MSDMSVGIYSRWPSGGGAAQLFVLCHVFERTITCSTASCLSSNSKGHGGKSSGGNVDDFAYKLYDPFYFCWNRTQFDFAR